MTKITALMNVYNEEEFFEHAIRSIYNAVDRIIVIDGAYNDRMPSHHSTDRTHEITFFDKLAKITYIKAHSATQTEQRNRVMSYITSGWLFIVDGDEVYEQDEISKLKHFLDSAKEDAYTINALVFTNTFEWFHPTAYNRLFRYRAGMHFVSANELTHNEGKYEPIRPIPKLTMYHYAYIGKKARLRLKEKQRKIKLGWKGRWMIPPYLVQRFKGEHPSIMLDHPYAKLKWDAGEYEIC